MTNTNTAATSRHDACGHPRDSEARKACRRLTGLVEAATRHGLEVTWYSPETTDSRTSTLYIWQVSIRNPRRPLDTVMHVTCSRGTPSVRVSHLTSPTEKVSWRCAFTWLEVISI